MAVITINENELVKLAGIPKEQVVDSLNDIGMPTEQGKEGELVVEITPNRPDLFSIEGLSRALVSYHTKKFTTYAAKKSDYAISIDKSVGKQRPFVVSAVVKNINMDEGVLKSMIQLQEKLHETIGRKRKKVAIGLHNAEEVVFPLKYKFVKEERFVPLDFQNEMSAAQILEKHPKGQAYAHLVGPDYPMLCDQKGVISFPPIINSERTRVTDNTRDIVIDVTGTHEQTLSKVLNIIACALADRGGEIHEVVVEGKHYPEITPAKMKVDISEINKLIGQPLQKKEVFENLLMMGWSSDGENHVFVPPYRVDVSHVVDVAEDVVIAYGYNNLKPTMPNFFTSGSVAKAHSQLSGVLVAAGFLEVVNYSLSNQEKISKTGDCKPLKIINPKTEDFTLLRTGILVSLLENLAANKTQELPIKIFEVGRVHRGDEKMVLGFAVAADVVEFSVLKGLLQTIAYEAGWDLELRTSDNGLFMGGRGADIYNKGKKIGFVGEISPANLETYKIGSPVGICEIELSGL